MSENLARAAEVLGAPEILVQRSAEARAAADGVSVEEVLAAWAGGGAPPSPSASAPAAAPSPAPAAAPEPAPVPAAAPAPEASPAPSAPSPLPAAASAPVVAAPLPPPSEVTTKEAVSFPVVVSVPTARLTERTSSTLPRWLAALFLVIPVIGLLYLAGNSARAGCVEGGVQLAVSRIDSTVVNCDGSEFTGRVEDTTGNILAVGEAVFETCAGCHGANGEGGVGPALATVLSTFSSCPDHIEWVTLATGGFQEAGIDTYGDLAATVGGGGFMPGFATSNTAEEIAAVVAFERIRFAGADPDQTLIECGLVAGEAEPEDAGVEEEAAEEPAADH